MSIHLEHLPDLRAQLEDFELCLDAKARIITKIHEKCPTLSCNVNSISNRCHMSRNTRNIIYVCGLFSLTIIAVISSNIIVNTVIDILYTSLLILFFFELNYFVFLQGIKRFDVYYKVINVGIAITLFKFLTNFDESKFGCTLHNYDLACRIDASFLVINNMISLFLLSLLDGYWFHHYLKILCLCVGIGYYTYCYINIYTLNNDSSKDDMIEIFGENYDNLHSIALTSMFSVIIFMIRQLYFVITKPNKLILTQTFVKFKVVKIFSDNLISQTELSSSDHATESEKSEYKQNVNNITHIHNTDLKPNKNKNRNRNRNRNRNKFSVTINRYETTLYRLLNKINKCTSTHCDNDKNTNICSNALKISQFLDSHYVWIFVFLFLFLFFIIVSVTDYKLIGWLHLSMLVFVTLILILVNLNINYLIVKYSLRSFVFWWKLQDCIVLMLLELFIDCKNKIGKFSLENNSLSEAYAMSVFNVIAPALTFSAISMVFGTFMTIRLKLLFIFLAIVYWAHGVVRIFLIDDENDVNISFVDGYNVSCKSSIVAKTFDIILWFVVQLIDQIRFNNGICVSGKVKRKWIGYDSFGNEYIYHRNDINNEFGFVLLAEQSSTNTAVIAN